MRTTYITLNSEFLQGMLHVVQFLIILPHGEL